ncbi:MAG TPA: protein kinase family protein [Bacteroidales bacterium]
MKNNIVEFIRSKDYRFIENIGQGGTGKTVLLKDEIINEFFVCKKYLPLYKSDKEKYFRNFIDEIKILHSVFHKNVVRVFNYYLYPEKHTGYILMEFIKGTQIYDFVKSNPETLNDIFVQTIDGFRYIEENKILHRDIRPQNILVSESGMVKIIDFGFGKKIEFEDDYDKSITLNWRFSIPNEFEKKMYDTRTEVYFVGKLFEELIVNQHLENFNYSSILFEMINNDYDSRINSFFDVSRKIITNTSNMLDFSDLDKRTYKRFASELLAFFNKKSVNAEYVSSIEYIQTELENIYRNSILEDIIQNPINVLNCFIRGEFYYNKKPVLHVELLKEFINLLRSVAGDKKKIILNNLWQRFDSIPIYQKIEDDLPF